MLLDVRDLSKAFGEKEVLSHLDFSVAEGEIIAVLGPSGCGKTTLLRCLAGFEAVTGGEMLLVGRKMNDLLPQDRPISTVFQAFGLFPHLNVFDNVAYGLCMQGVKRSERQERVERVLELVALKAYAQARIQALSGGQQQRVALARSLVIQPALLLLDEPFSSLDQQLRTRMHRQVKEILREAGTTSLLVTHDQAEAFTLADRIIVLHDGVIQQIGTAQELYEAPQTPFVLNFIGQVNRLGDGLYVRPEAVCLAKTPQAHFKKAALRRLLYLGGQVLYELKTAEGELLKASRQTLLPGVTEGDTLYYSYQAQKL